MADVTWENIVDDTDIIRQTIAELTSEGKMTHDFAEKFMQRYADLFAERPGPEPY